MPKKIGNKVWVHRSALSDLTAAQRRRVTSAARKVPDLTWSVVRVSPDSVMLGRTTHFSRPHPELLESATIKDGGVHRRCYADPPIYHRVELMLSSTDPLRSMHAQQTKLDEAAGLLSRPDIGRRSSWLRAIRQARKSRKT